MSDQIEYSVVLPAYLEEENLRLLLPRLTVALGSLPATWEVIVVDTATAMDGTEIARKLAGVRYVNRTPGNLFGDAVRTGIRESRGKWIAFMDADGSHAPEFLLRLIDQTRAFDIVIASRYVQGGQTENSGALKLMSRVLNATYAFFLDLHVRDISNSFKIYRADLLKELTLECGNFDIIEEILVRIMHRHPETRIVEIPFAFKQRMFGQTKRSLVKFMMTYFVTMLRLRRMIRAEVKPTN